MVELALQVLRLYQCSGLRTPREGWRGIYEVAQEASVISLNVLSLMTQSFETGIAGGGLNDICFMHQHS